LRQRPGGPHAIEVPSKAFLSCLPARCRPPSQLSPALAGQELCRPVVSKLFALEKNDFVGGGLRSEDSVVADRIAGCGWGSHPTRKDVAFGSPADQVTMSRQVRSTAGCGHCRFRPSLQLRATSGSDETVTPADPLCAIHPENAVGQLRSCRAAFYPRQRR